MISETKIIETRDKTKLHCEMIENGSPVWIIVTHGLGEHCKRHSHFFKMFSQHFSVCLYDLRGHGDSEGERANVEYFDKYVDDLEDVVQFLKNTYEMKRHIVFGHSMGGLVTSAYVQERAKESFYPEKVFLSSPAVAATGLLGEFFRVSPLKLNKLLAAAPLSVKLAGVLDLKKLSHDPRVYESYVKDPLNSLRIHSHLFLEILAKSREVFSRPLRVKSELYVAIGTEDELVNPKACIEYFKRVEKHAKLYVSQGGWHELHNEIERFRKPYLEFLEESIMDSIFN